jgi:hypothetical protein
MRLKKICYTPGLISLLGLPVLLLLLSPEDPVHHTCLRMAVPSDQKPHKGIKTFSKYGLYDLIKGKKLEQVSCWDDYDLYLIDRKITFARNEMDRLQFLNDTFSVLKIELGTANSYGDFISLLNQAVKDDYRRYALVDNSFYCFPNPPPKHYQDILLPMDVADADPEPDTSAFNHFMWYLYYRWQDVLYILTKNYILVTGFVLLIFIPAFAKIVSKTLSTRTKG